MTVFYLDLENGNDAADGLTFTNRWKTLNAGPTAARIAPGDEIRIMASPNETLIGDCGWTVNVSAVTLSAAVTANISTCQTAWTAATNVTVTADTTWYKEGTKSMKAVIAGAFTTGKIAHFTTGYLDLSAYQQVSFWFYNQTTTYGNGVFSLRLCSDTTGDITVHTIPIPANPSNLFAFPVTFDFGTNLSNIQSVALYAEVDPGAVTVSIDNIIACKARSSNDSLTLDSLIGKAWNLSWSPSLTLAQNDIRKPSQPKRNGFRYNVVTAGATSSTEPIWPTEVGQQITDGTVVWQCEGLEDSWFAIQSINGTTVKIDGGPQALPSNGRGYHGATENVPTYKREPIKLPMQSNYQTSNSSTLDSGTEVSPITFTGGWNPADMSTMTGETWTTLQNGNGVMMAVMHNWININNLSAVRGYYGIKVEGIAKITNSHFNNNYSSGIYAVDNNTLMVQGICVLNNNTGLYSGKRLYGSCVNGSSNGVQGVPQYGIIGGTYETRLNYVVAKNNGDIGYGSYSGSLDRSVISNLTTSSNVTAAVNTGSTLALKTSMILLKPNLAESVIHTNSGFSFWTDAGVYCHGLNGNANNHYNVFEGGIISSGTDRRHSSGGIAWKFRPTTTIRTRNYPLRLSIAKIPTRANTMVSVSIWANRDNANIKGRIVIPGGQAAGMQNDVWADIQPTVNVWELSSVVKFMPTENAVVEVWIYVWDGIGTTNALWIDDLTVTY